MNKILTKVATLALGAAMAVGVGAAVGSKKVSEAGAIDVTVNASSFTAVENTEIDQTLSGIRFTVTNGTVASGQVRVFKNQTLRVYAPANSNLTKIEFTCTAKDDAKYGPGCFAPFTGYTYSDTKGTWTGENDDNVDFTASTNQVRITSFTITYEAKASSDPEISLSKKELSFLDNGAAQEITVTPNDQFSATPTLSVVSTPAYVNVSFTGLTASVSPKAIGDEEVTIKATNGTQVATAVLSVSVISHHGQVADDPYTVAEALTIINGLADGGKTSKVYTAGVIKSIKSIDTGDYGNAEYYIKDASVDNELLVYRGYYLNGAKFTNANQIEAGGVVVVYGELKKYVKDSVTTPEIDSGNYLVSYEAPALDDFEVSFNANGGSGEMESVSTHGVYDIPACTFTAPTGKMFIGWKADNTGNLIADQASYTVEANVEFYAQWANAYIISFDPGNGSGSMDAVTVAEGSNYTLPNCTFTAPEGEVFDAWVYLGTRYTEIIGVDQDYEFEAIYKEAPAETSDTLTAELIGVTSYGNWSDISATSSAVYAGNSTKSSHNAIQMRSSNSNSGIVSTTSGGTIAKVIVEWNTTDAPTTARTLDIYAKASAYSAATDLYNSNTQGTKVGSLSYTNTTINETTLEIADEYAYVGVRSNSGAIYIDSITFVWSGSTPTPKVLESISVSNQKTAYEVNDSFVKPTVTAYYDDESEKDVSSKAEFSGYDLTVAGDYTVVVSYTENSVEKTTSYGITVSEPAPIETGTYKKVKTNLANFSGDYLIVYEGDDTHDAVAFDGSLSTLDANENNQSITISNETIQLSEAYEFNIAKKTGGYSVKSRSNLYIGATKYDNRMDTNAEDLYTNQVTYESGETKIISEGKDTSTDNYASLRFNYASNALRFRFMKTGQQPIALYVQVANDAEALALDILNLTYDVCQAESRQASDFDAAWETLANRFDELGDLKSVLVDGHADANGTFVAEALARYDVLVAHYGLDAFITGRVPNHAYVPGYQSSIDSSSSVTIIVIVAVASMTLLGVTLVLRKRKHQ